MSIFESIKEIRELPWEDVFSAWRNEEAHLPHWIEHFQKNGYASWDEWRAHTVGGLHPETMRWKEYEIIDPILVIPYFHGGPFRSWIKNYYEGRKTPTFAEIIENEAIAERQTIKEMLQNFPKQTTFVGLRKENQIFIIEGMHRCCAVAVAAKKNLPILSKMTIALADFSGKEIPLLGQATSPAA